MQARDKLYTIQHVNQKNVQNPMLSLCYPPKFTKQIVSVRVLGSSSSSLVRFPANATPPGVGTGVCSVLITQ